MQLVQRHSKGVVLTEAGLRLSTMSNLFFETLRRLPEPGGRSERGETILIGVPFSIAPILAPAIYLKVKSCHPQKRIELREMPDAELCQAIESHHIDIAFQYDPPKLESVTRNPVLEEELLVIASPAWDWLASQDALTVADLGALPLILPSLGQHERQKLSEAERKRGIRLQPVIENDNVSTVKMLVNRGVGLSVATALSVCLEVRAGLLQSRPFGKPTLKTRLSVCLRRADTMHVLADLANTISDAVREVSTNSLGVRPLSTLGYVLGT